MTVKTFWLSFGDPDTGKSLGVAIVDVTEADAAKARAEKPHLKRGAEWDLAAMQKAWDAGCNPGGEIMFTEITGEQTAARGPRNRLMQRADLIELGLIERPS